MAEEREVNIMSVELAIQRELAYRKRIAYFLSEAELADLLPLEVPCSSKVTTPEANPTHSLGQSSISPPRSRPGSHPISSLTMVSANEVTSSISNLKPSPMPQAPSLSKVTTPATNPTPISRQNFISPLGPGPTPSPISCQTTVSTNEVTHSIPNLKPTVPNQNPSPFMRPSQKPVSTHSEMARKATTSSLNRLPNQRQPYYTGNGPNIFCNICQVSCSSSLCYKMHVKGHKHKAKLSYMQVTGNGVGKENKKEQPRCNLCQILCTDETSLDLHLRGQKHKAKLQEIELGKKQKTLQHLWCELCHVPCNSEETFRLHLKGKSHASQLRAFKKQKKAI